MTSEEADSAQERNLSAKARFKEKRTEEQKGNVRKSDRIRKKQARDDRDEDQAAVETEIVRQRMETHRRVTKSKDTLKEGLRNQEVLNGTFPLLEDSADGISKMEVEYGKCGALKFRRETPGFSALKEK